MRPYQLLLVDEDPLIRRAFGSALERNGYAVATAANRADALAAVSATHTDLMITDVVRGAMDGIGLVKAAKQIRPDMMTIIMTGFGDMDLSIAALRAGCGRVSAQALRHGGAFRAGGPVHRPDGNAATARRLRTHTAGVLRVQKNPRRYGRPARYRPMGPHRCLPERQGGYSAPVHLLHRLRPAVCGSGESAGPRLDPLSKSSTLLRIS